MRILIPAHLLLAYSLARRLQERFAKDSAVALARAVGRSAHDAHQGQAGLRPVGADSQSFYGEYAGDRPK
jgi:hypothetical protein